MAAPAMTSPPSTNPRHVQCPMELVRATPSVGIADEATDDEAADADAPEASAPSQMVFTAGGIGGCDDWQTDLVGALLPRCVGLVLCNPRRESFDASRAGETTFQVSWEHRHLTAADGILFWFPSASLCPITLYELGIWAAHPSAKPIWVGVDPAYARAADVCEQLRLIRPEVAVVGSLDALENQVAAWYAARVVRERKNTT